MANVFGGSEIVEIGIQIEKNGMDFYDTLVNQSKNNKAKDIFKYLAGEEEKHIATFKKILDSVQKYEPPEAFSQEYFAYMNALASDYVFTRKDEGTKLAKKAKSDKDGVNLGISFEKESIIFYAEMKKMVPESDQNIVEQLIAQEQEHLRKLSDLKKEL